MQTDKNKSYSYTITIYYGNQKDDDGENPTVICEIFNKLCFVPNCALVGIIMFNKSNNVFTLECPIL